VLPQLRLDHREASNVSEPSERSQHGGARTAVSKHFDGDQIDGDSYRMRGHRAKLEQLRAGLGQRPGDRAES
jgi:hypothetical protein